MTIPSSSDARLFYRCAYLRFEEAQVLMRAGYTTGAVYLAGYSVECMLKAMAPRPLPASEWEFGGRFAGTKHMNTSGCGAFTSCMEAHVSPGRSIATLRS